MEKKTLFGKDYTDSEWIKIILYLFVGGTAALVEWMLFGVGQVLGINYLVATAIAFIISTLYHYFLGNILVFTSGVRYGKRKELSLIFAVSVMGLVFNLILMYGFVSILSLDPMLGKVLASCIVVVWNYLARKIWIFG